MIFSSKNRMKITVVLVIVNIFYGAVVEAKSASQQRSCKTKPPMLDGASLYMINDLVAKYSCLPPYRGHAYARCNSFTFHWSRVNLTCVNIKIPPDQAPSLNLPPREKIILSNPQYDKEPVVAASVDALNGIQLSDGPPAPPNTHLVANILSTKSPRADAVVKTCGIPPQIPGTIFIVVNDFMVKYACIDEQQGAVRWKNYAYYFCTNDDREWRGSPPECGWRLDINNKIHLRARKLENHAENLRVQHQPRSLPARRRVQHRSRSIKTRNNNRRQSVFGSSPSLQDNFSRVRTRALPNSQTSYNSGTRRRLRYPSAPRQSPRTRIRPQSTYRQSSTSHRQNTHRLRPRINPRLKSSYRYTGNGRARYGARNASPLRSQPRNQMLSESKDAMLPLSNRQQRQQTIFHYQPTANVDSRNRRPSHQWNINDRETQTRPQRRSGDWSLLVTSSSAQLTEPLGPPPAPSSRHILHDKREGGEEEEEEDNVFVSYVDKENERPEKTSISNSKPDWERLKLRSETELSVATIDQVVSAKDARRQAESLIATSSERHQHYQHRHRLPEDTVTGVPLANKIIDEEEVAEEEERSRQDLLHKNNWERCDVHRACVSAGPRIGRRATVVYRSFDSQRACPGDFVRIACQSGHNTSWHTSFCTHRRYWTFVPSCGG